MFSIFVLAVSIHFFTPVNEKSATGIRLSLSLSLCIPPSISPPSLSHSFFLHMRTPMCVHTHTHMRMLALTYTNTLLYHTNHASPPPPHPPPYVVVLLSPPLFHMHTLAHILRSFPSAHIPLIHLYTKVDALLHKQTCCTI